MPKTERKELRLTPELAARVEEVRGDTSFNLFVERALEAVLAEQLNGRDEIGKLARSMGMSPDQEMVARSSAMAKQGVKPRPKTGKR